jgi:hypothetical protein
MVARLIHNKNGQSLLEVVFVLPFLFLFVGLLFKLNLSMQQSINNTQFSRSQIFVLTANSPEYPRLAFTHYAPSPMFSTASQDMMVLGVSDPKGIDGESGSKIEPIPQVQAITRNKSVKGNEDAGEQKKRSEIRIRNTAAICTQLNVVPVGTSQRWPYNTTVCQYKGMGG